jgi:DNA-binding NarL/FixJ family response regulator
MDFIRSSFLPECGVNPKIRVLLREMPRLMQDILERTISTQTDMEIVKEDFERSAVSTDAVAPDVVILSATRTEDMHNASVTLLQWPRVQVLTITADGHQSALYQLVPQKTTLGEMSPVELVDAIRLRLRRS